MVDQIFLSPPFSFLFFCGGCVCTSGSMNGLCVDIDVCMYLSCVCACRPVCIRVWAYQVSVPVLAKARRGDRWSWDPDEERKRQERWQQEQERMLQVHGNHAGKSMAHECARPDLVCHGAW